MPDGKTLLFASKRSGRSQIWTIDRDGGPPRPSLDCRHYRPRSIGAAFPPISRLGPAALTDVRDMYASIGAANALLRKRLRSKLDIMKLPTTSKRKRLTLKDEAVERPQDYLRIGASLLPKQMDVETDRPRQLIEYSNEELLCRR